MRASGARSRRRLRAFVSLLGVRRFFAPDAGQLPALFERSLKHQDEVTDALGEQVRRAVEVLVQALDRADQDRNRELLHDVTPQELYEAGLTVMMRLVFLLRPRSAACCSWASRATTRSTRSPRCACSSAPRATRSSSGGALRGRGCWPCSAPCWRHRSPDAAPAGAGRLAVRSRPLPVPRRPAEGHVLAAAPRRTAAHRRPHGPAAARSHPDLRGAHARRTARSTSSRSATSTRACSNAPSSASTT